MSSHSPQKDQLSPEQKKTLVIDFFDDFVMKLKFDLQDKYIGSTYRQHNPNIADGPEGLKEFALQYREVYPNGKVDIKKTFVDGNHVIIHSHVFLEPDTLGFAAVDIFRLEGSKVVEHWDVLQAIPETSKNENTMF